MADYSQDVLAKARDYDLASAPLKTRVHALAKQLGLTSKEMIEALGHAGIVVKAASSTVNHNQLEAVLKFVLSTDTAAESSSSEDNAPEESAAREKSTETEVDKPAEKATKKSARTTKKKTAKQVSAKKAGAKKADAKKADAKKSHSQSDASDDAVAAEQTQDVTEFESDKPAKKATKKSAQKSTRKTSKRTHKRAAIKSAEHTPTVEEITQAGETVVEPADVSEKKASDAAPTSKATPSETATPETAASETAASETAASAAKPAQTPAAEQQQQEKAKPRTRRRRARRTVHRGSATAPSSVPADASETTPEVTAETAPETAAEVTQPAAATLHDVEPPITAEPQDETFEQSRYAPVFLAPQQPSESTALSNVSDESGDAGEATSSASSDSDTEAEFERQPRPRRRRGRGRGRRRVSTSDTSDDNNATTSETDADSPADGNQAEAEHEVPEIDEPQAIRGSTRLEAQRRRRNERREESRKRHVLSEAEFLARRESVERTMVVRERRRHDHAGIVTEVGVLEDDLLVEHFVTSDTQTTQIGNVYLGRVQNVLPSMEAAFVDIGTDRNGVIYAGDLNWKLLGSRGRSRKIEHALKSGDQILVQVTKDPIGHKGARLSMHISLAGRFLVYVPGGRSAGISRKLPEPERKRLKEILQEVTPAGSGTIIRTAAEGVSKDAIADDVNRLETLWNDIFNQAEQAKARKGAKPITLYKEPDMLVKVVRDVFNEDFSRLVVEGDRPWNTVTDYIGDLAPELEPRLQRYFAKEHGGADVFEHFRIDEQLAKALDRKVWLPSGGTLVIDRTEAMTVIDVNTGKFTGSGGNLEETVTRNNLEAAEEIVRQMRLRDLGGMIVVDFIDMVLPENQELVLRRLKEALGRDRTRHEVSEVTSLGLVQMTRKRLGTGLLETFSTPCSCCNGRGLIIHIDPVEQDNSGHGQRRGGNGHNAGGDDKRRKKISHDPQQHPAALAMHQHDEARDQDISASNGQETKQDESHRELTSDEIVAAAVDAVVVASEKEEPRPPRRKRSRRKSQRVEQRVDYGAEQDNSGSKSDSHSVDKTEQNTDDKALGLSVSLAEVAAAAVAEAKEKDPEEPSDDRYVAHHPRRRRRATRSATLSAATREKSDKRNADSTADAKTAQGKADPQGGKSHGDHPETDAPHTAESKGRASRRAGRRAVRRVRRVAKPVAEQIEIAKAEESSESLRGGRSYEEAVAEFENSPRRRRPTRGKSRSDHAPRREDFETSATLDAPTMPDSTVDAKQQESQDQRRDNNASKATKSSRRSGRRSARRIAKRTQPTATAAERSLKAVDKSNAEPESGALQTSAVDKSAESATTSGRRRRRAVRRTSMKQSAQPVKARSAREEVSVKSKKRSSAGAHSTDSGEPSGETQRQGRRRSARRAVRRNASSKR